MALADLLKRPDQSELRARLTAEALAASNHFVRCQLAWADAAADEAAGYGGAAATEEAEKALIEAKRQADRAAAALRSVEARLAAAETNSEKARIAEAWEKAERLAESRLKAARRLATSAESFAKDWLALVEATDRLRDAVPVLPDPAAAHVEAIGLELGIRAELQRLGVVWAFSHPSGKTCIPEFLLAFEGTASVIQRFRAGTR